MGGQTWSDVTALDDEGFHYMGYIVLQQKEQYQHEVILMVKSTISNLVDYSSSSHESH